MPRGDLAPAVQRGARIELIDAGSDVRSHARKDDDMRLHKHAARALTPPDLRSLVIAARRFPVLAGARTDGPREGESFAALNTAVSSLNSRDAGAATTAVFQNFCDALAGVIGVSLGVTLLRVVESSV